MSNARLTVPEKRVTFSPTCTVVLDTRRGSPHTKQEKSKLYYSKDELSTMYLETQAICTLSRALGPENGKHDMNNSVALQLAEAARRDCIFAPEALRGLELILYPTRRKNKILAQKSFLKYQALLNSKCPNLSIEHKQVALALASAKLNAWSSLVAAETGRLDALSAYEADYLIPVKEPVSLSTPFAFYKNKKQERRWSRRVTLEEEQQSKRRRKNEEKSK